MSRAASTLDITFTGVLLTESGKKDKVRPYVIEVSLKYTYVYTFTNVGASFRACARSLEFIHATNAELRPTSAKHITILGLNRDSPKRLVMSLALPLL
jgi:hypothetical protein